MTALTRDQRNAASGNGALPEGGFAPLVPELDVTDMDRSLAFWCDLLGFEIAYDRPEAKFAYLQRQGRQIMLCEINGNWRTGDLHRPFGRGINLQITTDALEPILEALAAKDWPLFEEAKENWYRTGATHEGGSREFLVQDPDGYLLRFSQPLGERVVAPEGP